MTIRNQDFIIFIMIGLLYKIVSFVSIDFYDSLFSTLDQIESDPTKKDFQQLGELPYTSHKEKN